VFGGGVGNEGAAKKEEEGWPREEKNIRGKGLNFSQF